MSAQTRFAALVVAVGCAFAAPAAAAPGALAMPTIDSFTLPNGLQVAVMHRSGAPVVAVHVWYHAGSKDEPRDRRGTAHMFEHMMFKGSARVPPESHAQLINRLGG